MKENDEELVYLNDKVVKKALSTDTPLMREYVSNIIHACTGIPLEDLRGNLKLAYPEVSYNINTVNSISDLAFYNDKAYFSIEVNYKNNSKTRNVSNLFYVYQLSLKQVSNSKDYIKLKPIYQIQINYTDYFGKGDLLYVVQFQDTKYHIPYLEKYNQIFIINLDYFRNRGYNDVKKKEKEFFRLFYLFICDDKEKLKELYEGDEMMEEVQETFDTLGKVIDGNLYLNRKIYEDTVAYEDGQAEGYEKGQAEGYEKGQADGFERGQVDGHISGLEDGKRIIARNLLSYGTPIKDIAKLTSLTIEEINKLRG